MKKAALVITGLLLVAVLAVVLYVVVGSRVVAAQVERNWRQRTVAPLTEIGSTQQLEIIPLYEEAGDSSRYQVGHGLSYLVRTDGGSILLDVGLGTSLEGPLPVEMNMQLAGIKPEEIDAIVFSHFHADHSGGVEAWRQGKAYLGELDGLLPEIAVVSASEFDVAGESPRIAEEPLTLLPAVATTGAIQFLEPFPIYLFQARGAEQGLVIQLADDGLVLITGCGHPGVEKMVKQAEFLLSAEVVAVVGGVHSDGLSPEQIQADIEFLKAEGVGTVAISPHDSGAGALAAYRAAFGNGYHPVRVGEPIVIR